jgi:hypothetical protein
VFAGQTLSSDGESHGDSAAHYILYQSPVALVYFTSESNALSYSNYISLSASYGVESRSGYSFWKIASNSTGTSSQSGIYRAGQTVAQVGSYFLYPASNVGSNAGTPYVKYFPSQADSQNNSNMISQNISLTLRNEGGYSAWLVDSSMSVSLVTYSSNTAYFTGDTLFLHGTITDDYSAKYHVYPVSVVYYYNRFFNGDNFVSVQIGYSSYTVSTVGGYSNWVIINYSTGSSPDRIAYASGETLNADGTYYLFPKSVLWYYANQGDAEADRYSIANSLSGTAPVCYRISVVGGVDKWYIASNSTGTSSPLGIYVAGTTLNTIGTYYLYPYIAPVYYYANQADASSELNAIESSTYTVGIGNAGYIVASSGWKVSSSSTGTSSQSVVYTHGQTLDAVGTYHLYPNTPFFIPDGPNSTILCKVNGVDTYISIQSLNLASNVINLLFNMN